jgi:uracil-DNA glycosylase family 4
VPADAGSPPQPGTWPGDPAGPDTPVAHSADEVAELAGTGSLAELTARQSVCRACPRLVAWREEVAVTRRRAFRDEPYWGRPIAGWGSEQPRVLIVGLAPAAHGGNRTGRIFTGDRSGDWLFAALYRAGLANQPVSRARDDGLKLRNCWVCAAVRCAPPANKPAPAERDNCLPYLGRELELLTKARVVVCLGLFAWNALLRLLANQAPRPRPKFGHGAQAQVGRLALLGCYHPSQQNTFTGKLTEAMMDDVFTQAVELAKDAAG